MRWQTLLRRKPLEDVLAEGPPRPLRRSLDWVDLTGLGLEAIVGTGVFVLTGVVAARYAGPGVVLSLLLAGVAAALSALVYAELAAMTPRAGSAYTYAYVALGEIFAWVVGWNLVLEYTVAAAAVAVGWGGYLVDALRGAGVALPPALVAPRAAGGGFNLPAALAAVAAALLVARGTRQSATVTRAVVAVKLLSLAAFLAVGVPRVDPGLWSPFLPYGVPGVPRGAAVIFLRLHRLRRRLHRRRGGAPPATRPAAGHPRRPRPRLRALRGRGPGAHGPGALPRAGHALARGPRPAAPGPRRASAAVGAGVLAGLTRVLLVNVYGQTRIFYAMARDGLLPGLFARLHPRTRTPVWGTLLTGAAVAVLAGMLPVRQIAELANLGTLGAFAAVSVGAVVLRRTEPARPRPFRVPGMPWTAAASALAALALMTRLPTATWQRYGVWMALGLVLYLAYGRRRARATVPGGAPGGAGGDPAGHAGPA